LSIDKGRTHDYKIFKKSKSSRKIIQAKVLADSGYQGIQKVCNNAQIPKKKTKLHPLTKENKLENHKLSSKCIIIEHIKVFKITKYPYKNR